MDVPGRIANGPIAQCGGHPHAGDATCARSHSNAKIFAGGHPTGHVDAVQRPHENRCAILQKRPTRRPSPGRRPMLQLGLAGMLFWGNPLATGSRLPGFYPLRKLPRPPGLTRFRHAPCDPDRRFSAQRDQRPFPPAIRPMLSTPPMPSE